MFVLTVPITAFQILSIEESLGSEVETTHIVASLCHQSNILLSITILKTQKSSWITRINTCPICEKKILKHSCFILCNFCHRNVHRNCSQFSCDEFTVVKTGALWYCRICNEKIFPINNIDDDHEFHLAITETEMKLFDANQQNKFSESKIFDPFEINENDDSIIEYQGELAPDKHYFNQLAHYLSRSSNYYSEEILNKLISLKGINSEGVSVLHANIRSVPGNLSIFLSYMSNINLCFSVIGISETWLSPFPFDTYGVNGYRHVGLTRMLGRAGGVSLYIAEKFTYTHFSELDIVNDHIECVFAKIHLNGQTYITGVVYHPPNSNIVDFNNTMHSILEKVTQYPCHIIGDFNLDLLKHDKHPPAENFLDIMYANSFIPMINRPTSLTKDTCTLIDNIYTNHYSIKNDNYSGILTTDISDHFPVFHVSPKSCEYPTNNEYKTIHVINEIKTLKFMEKIQNINWSALDPFEHCQIYFSNFLRLFKNIYDESFPIIRVKIKYRNRLPWLSNGLKSSIKLKNKLYRISLKHPTTYNIYKYKQYKKANIYFEIWRKAILSTSNFRK